MGLFLFLALPDYAEMNLSFEEGVLELSFSSQKVAEKALATHSSTLAWTIPWTEGPGGLQSMRSLRVGQD